MSVALQKQCNKLCKICITKIVQKVRLSSAKFNFHVILFGIHLLITFCKEYFPRNLVHRNLIYPPGISYTPCSRSIVNQYCEEIHIWIFILYLDCVPCRLAVNLYIAELKVLTCKTRELSLCASCFLYSKAHGSLVKVRLRNDGNSWNTFHNKSWFNEHANLYH